MKTQLFSLFLLTTSVVNAVFARTLVVDPGSSIQAKIIEAKAGDEIRVMPGIYSETVFIDKDELSLIGLIKSGKRPILDGLGGKYHDGIIVAGHNVTVQGFHIRDYKSNGITTQGANNFVIRNNLVEGAMIYGLFPQFGKNGLVAQNIVSGSTDAAIYVGMSENVDIIANEVFNSVLGIEVENSHRVLVESNFAHNNTVGIMVNLLPGLHTKSSSNTIVRNNIVVANNTDNFAHPGTLAASVSTGYGITIMAADLVSVEGNVIRDNNTCGVCVMDHNSLGGFPVDEEVDPRPDDVHIYTNIYRNNGGNPSGTQFMKLKLQRGADIVNLARGRNNCLDSDSEPLTLGVDRWRKCNPGASTADLHSYQLRQALTTKPLTLEEQARLTYLAVCSGCHAYKSRLIGPPIIVIQALYRNKPEQMSAWIANPGKIRQGFPEMPPQDYLSEELRLELARYILEKVPE